MKILSYGITTDQRKSLDGYPFNHVQSQTHLQWASFLVFPVISLFKEFLNILENICWSRDVATGHLLFSTNLLPFDTNYFKLPSLNFPFSSVLKMNNNITRWIVLITNLILATLNCNYLLTVGLISVEIIVVDKHCNKILPNKQSFLWK